MSNVKVPELGESIIEGTLTAWVVKEGDIFKSGDNLAEIETEKITIEIPAQSDGVLSKILVVEGATVKVGEVIAEYSEGAGETTAQVFQPKSTPVEPTQEEKTIEKKTSFRRFTSHISR
jgi:2-oxoglutarate dehydrogenase E2 component (dihydrolipoamide succinyltransferase)